MGKDGRERMRMFQMFQKDIMQALLGTARDVKNEGVKRIFDSERGMKFKKSGNVIERFLQKVEHDMKEGNFIQEGSLYPTVMEQTF